MAIFFVEPIIFEKSEYERSELVRKGEKREVPIQLKDLIQSEDNILFIGKKESGKTTILQRFGIFHACIESKYIPVYIDMMKLNKGKDRIFLACQNFVFNNISSDMSITKNQIRNMLLNGKLICLFDNINISNVDHCLWIQNFVRAFPDNRFIFSCEEKFYQTYTLKELPQFGAEYKSVYLEYFGRRQVREMVTKWGGGKSGFNANEMTQRIVTYCSNIHFAMTPFNIAVFMTIWDVDRNFVPVNEGKVMRTYLETVLDKFSAEDFQRSKYDYDVKQHFLGYLAYAMCQKDEYFFSIDEFNNLVDKYHDKKGFKKSESKFDVIFFEKNILCINGTCVYFSNTSIMEYCLASYAISEPTLYELMTAKGNRSNFIHELSFYSGIIPDCSKLLNSLNDEITSTILENMDILDEIEKLSINLEFDIKKDTFKEAIINNRYSIEEVDELTELKTFDQEHSPMKISKINSVEESESFMDLLLIYGNVIKNAEIVDKEQKKIHLENYILGMNFQFGLIMKEFAAYLTSKTKEDLPDEIKGKYPNLTDEEYEKMKQDTLELIKIVLPIAIQFNIANNVGSPKLEIVISELIQAYKDRKFTRFMLSFLFCDIGNGSVKTFLMNYIEEETSPDILKLILVKLGFYYNIWYFGKDAYMDEMLLDLITETQIKLSGQKSLLLNMNKGEYKKQIKRRYDTQRKELVG